MGPVLLLSRLPTPALRDSLTHKTVIALLSESGTCCISLPSDLGPASRSGSVRARFFQLVEQSFRRRYRMTQGFIGANSRLSHRPILLPGGAKENPVARSSYFSIVLGHLFSPSLSSDNHLRLAGWRSPVLSGRHPRRRHDGAAERSSHCVQ